MDENSGPISDETALKQAMGRAIAHARVDAGFATQAAFSRAIDVRLETLAKLTGVLGIAMPEFLARVAEQMRQPTPPPATRRGRKAAE
jgi:hypothetical protein